MTMKVTGCGPFPPHRRLPFSSTGSAGAVTRNRLASTLCPTVLKPGIVPAGARESDLPLPKVIRSGAKVTFPVMASAVLL
jgi:hypothetical protein